MLKRSRTRGRLQLITVLVIGYWLLLFVSTHIPLQQNAFAQVSDKSLHFLAYGGLAFLAAWMLSQKRELSVSSYLLIWTGVAFYGVVDELSQMLPFIRRSADLKDWLADITGAACALLVFSMFCALKKAWRSRTALI